jgi:predicted aldo/keto reductase-like oxidoreductase
MAARHMLKGVLMDKVKWERLGIESSRLGYGCMRFPVKEKGEIDEVKAEALLDTAYKAGITYYDTAYIYHNSKSEEFMGRCLSKYPRESYTIATKLPMMMTKTLDDAKRIFAEQLQRLQKEYVDFYLLHGLDAESFRRAVDLGIVDFCDGLKKDGKIRYFGFSFHDDYKAFEEIINYRQWDFCQIQLNYMDTEEQAGLKGYYLAEKLGVPLVIMEPVKGGSLAALPETVAEDFTRSRPSATQASWAMHWIGGLSNAKVILSGMTTMDQLQDNIKTFTNFKPLSDDELKVLRKVREKIGQRVKNGCTGCRYCMPCPVGVDIPENFALWNKYGMYENKGDIAMWWNVFMKDDIKAKNCVKCGQCEEKCPQKLSIRDDLEKLQKELDAVAAAK